MNPAPAIALCAAALLVAACGKEASAPTKPAAAPATTGTVTTGTAAAPATPAEDKKKEEVAHGYEPGGLPGLGDALKGEPKKEEAKPAAPAADPAKK